MQIQLKNTSPFPRMMHLGSEVRRMSQLVTVWGWSLEEEWHDYLGFLGGLGV